VAQHGRERKQPANLFAGCFHLYSMRKLLVTIGVLLFLSFWAIRYFENHDHPIVYEIADFPVIKQPDQITCGPTSALMVLSYYQKTVTMDEIKVLTKTEWVDVKGKPLGMTSPDYIARALRNYNLSVKMRVGNLEMVKHYVSQNKPVIVLVRSDKVLWHYMVVIGYTEDKVILADPGFGVRYEMTVSDFVNSWGFSTDMYGNSVHTRCPFCTDGKIFAAKLDLGPLNICDFCNATGKQPDYLCFLLRAAGVYPNTLILASIDR